MTELEVDYLAPLRDISASVDSSARIAKAVMLLGRPDAGLYAASKSLATVPGTTWQYSSGTTNIIRGRIARSSMTMRGMRNFRDSRCSTGLACRAR